ncbi:OprD family outer membrane porin [Thiocapsa bogorovii]|uniref:OprD family outer membrane porin n=1 Tax=Thiocapsa bogorovii TaxID=521689 RepID=UPI001E4F9781|nr:OprD family outer membrane porin [Thiocapsa bogorovii]UHD15670.1 OprD family porin [Thiocapsa bogorovii]
MCKRYIFHGHGGQARQPLLAAVAARCVLAAVIFLISVPPSLAQQEIGTGSRHGYHVQLHELSFANPEPTLPVPRHEAIEQMPFFADTKFDAQLKTFYLTRDKFDPSRVAAWALGGSLSYRSGYLRDLVRIGAVGYTSQPLWAPEEYDGTQLLKLGQEGYTVLGQAYAEAKLTDSIFAALGRKAYETPYINKHDVRMTPNTFEGVTVYGTAGGVEGSLPAWRFGGGFISKIKNLDSDEFVWMSERAGAPDDVERGVYLAGVNYQNGGLSVGAINYYSADIINIFYADATYQLPAINGYKLTLGGQYSDQRSTGSNLLTGASFSTRQWGLKADMGIASAVLTLAYTGTANGADMRSPWGGYPGYTSVQVEDFDRAGEDAWMFKVAYDFSRQGAKGLTAYALAVLGNNVSAPYRNQNEYDLNLQWTPDRGLLKGASFRLRYARVDQRGSGDEALNDFRLIATYDF